MPPHFVRKLYLIGITSHLGTGGPNKTDEFSVLFQGGGGMGVIFNPKIYIADFDPLNRAF